MTPEAFRILRRLAGGAVLDGAGYADRAGIACAAVLEHIERLRRSGLPVLDVPGGGYRLAWSIELLNVERIRRAGGLRDIGLAVYPSIGSTNDVLAQDFRHRHALLAEYQSGARGRRGRNWISPPGCAISISFGYRFDHGLPRLAPLSLIAGVAAAEVLVEAGVPVGLKWPNDLVVDDRKIGGLLIEIRGTGAGPCRAVIGLGINARLARAEQAPFDHAPVDPGPVGYTPPDQPWTDIYAITRQRPHRNRLAGRLIAALDSACREFERAGFEPFAQRWDALDALRGRRVRATAGKDPALVGLARGVTASGKLRVAAGEAIVELDAGEVSVRAE